MMTESATTEGPSQTTAEPVVAERPAHRLREKWGDAMSGGFVAIPTVLIHDFYRLKVTPGEFVILLNLLSHWWEDHKRPFPRVTTVARRMGYAPRTVQRSLNRLRAAGLLSWERVQVRDGKIVKNGKPGDGVRRRRYDLRPLVRVAQNLADYHERAKLVRPEPVTQITT